MFKCHPPSILLLFLPLFLLGCKEDKDYTLTHSIQNSSTATLTFRFTNDPQLLDTLFVIPPGVSDTLILYTDNGPVIPYPNCGLGSVSRIDVAGGGTLIKDPSDPDQWEVSIDDKNKVSSCTFVVQDEDIQ